MSVEAVKTTDVACKSQFVIMLKYVEGREPVDDFEND